MSLHVICIRQDAFEDLLAYVALELLFLAMLATNHLGTLTRTVHNHFSESFRITYVVIDKHCDDRVITLLTFDLRELVFVDVIIFVGALAVALLLLWTAWRL